MIAGPPKAKNASIKKFQSGWARNFFLYPLKIASFRTICLILIACLPASLFVLNPLQTSSMEIDSGVSVIADSSLALASDTDVAAETIEKNEHVRYSFASVQTSSKLSLDATGTQGCLYFYNVDGNRTTHIDLETICVPQGIEVEFVPGSRLEVEPSDICSEPLEYLPDSVSSIKLPGKLGNGVDGYCQAHVVDITVSAAESQLAPGEHDLEILATASWPGQTGQVVIQQTRTFRFELDYGR